MLAFYQTETQNVKWLLTCSITDLNDIVLAKEWNYDVQLLV